MHYLQLHNYYDGVYCIELFVVALSSATLHGSPCFSDEEGPPLGNRELRNLIILSELPFVVSFEERVKVSELKSQTGQVYFFPTYLCERQCLLS